MNLYSLREAIRTKTAYPERGDTGKARLNRVINYALRQLRRDAPEALFREEWRFNLETEFSTGTINVDTSDPLCMIRVNPSTHLATDGTLRARWIEIKKGDTYHIRRIRDVYELPAAPPSTAIDDIIVLDKPWMNSSDTNLTYRIFTYEYPYPVDVEKIRSVIRNPETNPRELMETLHPESLAAWRLGVGWRDTGSPDKYARGDFYQQDPPHYTPTAVGTVPYSIDQTKLGGAWGYDSNGDEQTAYGPAGKFSYRVCHVWGRLPHLDVTQEGNLVPFYLSAPSPASDKIETFWGGGYIQVDTPHIDYVYGYGHNGALKSYLHSGIEKWIFRARHDIESPTSPGNNADVKSVEADDIYHLWRITDASTTSTYDRGDDDPVDKRFQLKESHGHFHLRFDKSANVDDVMLCRAVRRPAVLKHDTDTPHIPPDCFEALVSLACAYLVGDRDGNPKRKTFYYTSYTLELDRLKKAYTFSGAEHGPFGNGLSSWSRYGVSPHDITEA